MTFVIDASVAACWCFEGEQNALADDAWRAFSAQNAITPAIWWFEIRNVLVINERKGRIDADDALVFLKDLARLPIAIDRDADSDMLMQLAKTHRLTAYDAAYLELALRLHAPLASLDAALMAAAVREGLSLLNVASE